MYKSYKHLAGINFPVIKLYIPDYAIWGIAAAGAIATFTDGVPLFRDTFYSKIPYFGSHYVHNPDPEDVPV